MILVTRRIDSSFEPAPKPTTLTHVLGILRLSHKYDVRYLRRRALLHLETVYPVTLEAYDRISTTATFNVAPQDHILVARAAMQVEATWLVPPACYRPCCGGVASICDLVAEETTIDSQQRTCLTALVLQAWTYGVTSPLHETINSVTVSCPKVDPCKREVVDLTRGFELDMDILLRWRSDLGRPFSNLGAVCADSVRTKISGYRELWWAHMHLRYRLQEWPDLLLLRASALDLP
jgi:hypothetical protein